MQIDIVSNDLVHRTYQSYLQNFCVSIPRSVLLWFHWFTRSPWLLTRGILTFGIRYRWSWTDRRMFLNGSPKRRYCLALMTNYIAELYNPKRKQRRLHQHKSPFSQIQQLSAHSMIVSVLNKMQYIAIIKGNFFCFLLLCFCS